MKIHYYFDWFNDTMPKQIAEALLHDIPIRKSLVFICATPSEHEFNAKQLRVAKEQWLDLAGVTFEEYHLIDYRMTKEEARDLLRNASAIFLLGGKAAVQNTFLDEYELHAAIKESNAAVIMGVSAGAMNMSAKWISSKHISPDSARHTTGKTKIYDGLGLDDFALEAHIDMDNNELIQHELLPLSQKLDVYAACYDSVIRVKDGKREFFGDVYLVSDSKMCKMEETGFAE
ncbi:MAG: Type 1 glutamine amidotransferase-like domain-containing protein [Defluviitaleaceae bacterium]|nr:Type 1 glutamine amidotransferase-like domain-containing protein [Defluviitaleaceae bacterium]